MKQLPQDAPSKKQRGDQTTSHKNIGPNHKAPKGTEKRQKDKKGRKPQTRKQTPDIKKRNDEASIYVGAVEAARVVQPTWWRQLWCSAGVFSSGTRATAINATASAACIGGVRREGGARQRPPLPTPNAPRQIRRPHRYIKCD
jgi:hypothetical protein